MRPPRKSDSRASLHVHSPGVLGGGQKLLRPELALYGGRSRGVLLFAALVSFGGWWFFFSVGRRLQLP